MMPSSPLDFRLLFESTRGLFLVLAPDLTILAPSDAFLHSTMTRREDLLGRGFFGAFAQDPASRT